MNDEVFRQFGYRFVDWVSDYLKDVGEYPVTPSLRPGGIKSMLPDLI